ncbi:MAG: BamA/TamA family outer membrane protein [Candidatus Solibacter sp.]|nr:BamA/TamA family outer membrane protein [Candidatus Solibacter sp.]
MNSDRTLWPSVSASVRPEANGMVPIHVSGLRLVREARVSLTGAEVAVNDKDQAKLDDFRQRGAKKVQETHPELFAGLRGHVPRLGAVQNVTEKLGKPREVEGPFVVKSKDGVIFYEGNFRYVISLLDAKFDARLGLNPEERFTAGGSVSGAKLFYLVPKLFGRPAAGDLGERHSLTAKGGPDFQTIDYTLSRDIGLWSGKLLPSLDMDWKRDSEQRFGPAFQPVPEVVARGIRPGISWTQFVEAGEKSRLSRSLSFDLGLPVRHTRLISKGASAADLINAQVTALSFEMRVGVGYEFTDAGKKGVRLRAGHANLQLHTNSKRGWQIMGGDSTFFKHAVDVDAVLPWGFTMPDQFQVRYARGAATASRSTPLFELYPLGGSDNLRGVEAGEFVGRNLSWEQAEFGYNLFEPMDGLTKLLSKRKKAPAAAPPAPAAPPTPAPTTAPATPAAAVATAPAGATPAPTTAPAAAPEPAATAETEAPAGGGISGFLRQNGITTLLLKVAHDRGLTTNGGRSLGDLFSLPHAGHGWGVGFELGGLRTAAGSVSITLMRARSSASYVHPNGAWITGVRMTF